MVVALVVRFWVPLVIAAALVCCFIAYARHEAREDAEWQSVMDAATMDAKTWRIKR